MKTTLLHRAAIGALATTLLVVGCKPGGQGGVASAGSRAPSPAKAAAQFAAMGETAMRKRDAVLAVAMAERAVATQPQVARYRAQLGQSYLLAGRFASAIDAFRDAATVAPDDGRVRLGMALAQGALDRQDAARASVAAADGRIGDADRGLALALAGDDAGAIALLEPAARRSDATPKTRQNLALAYALAGRWDVARSTAAQDLQPGEVDARMQSWAKLARPQPRMDRIAAFLGVTPAVADAGMPTMLALGADPAAPVAVAVATAAAPETTQAAPTTVVSMTTAPSDVPAAADTSEPTTPSMLVRTVASARPAPPALVSVPPLPPRAAPPAMLMRTSYVATVPRRGQWAVQLGAFSSGRSIEAAWNKVSRTVRPVAGMVPLSSTIRTPAGLFQRLAVGGLTSRTAAVALCEQVRSARGVCFVRTIAGEAPVRMADRRARGAQVASR